MLWLGEFGPGVTLSPPLRAHNEPPKELIHSFIFETRVCVEKFGNSD